MFSLPQVIAEFLWESSARVLVDYGVGGGMAIRCALTMHVKVVGICFNADHIRVVKKNTLDWILKQLQARKSNLAPSDFDARLENARDPREVQWASQKKRGGNNQDLPDAKRHASAPGNLDNLLDDVFNSEAKTKPEPKPKAKPEPKAAPKPTPEPKPEAAGENPEDLARLLADWGK